MARTVSRAFSRNIAVCTRGQKRSKKQSAGGEVDDRVSNPSNIMPETYGMTSITIVPVPKLAHTTPLPLLHRRSHYFLLHIRPQPMRKICSRFRGTPEAVNTLVFDQNASTKVLLRCTIYTANPRTITPAAATATGRTDTESLQPYTLVVCTYRLPHCHRLAGGRQHRTI